MLLYYAVRHEPTLPLGHTDVAHVAMATMSTILLSRQAVLLVVVLEAEALISTQES